ncbi:hypothetical protein [Halomonas nitroreducens]|uniref:Uncharacterized protein n=1 Tax=Halomonas nitroreducens TaxID=447425 RepID=A0A3S0HSG6_9GAMM|nr:hypothetical protein [Halomonas nitroreducens]RTR01944.1 hypothetical protein EKG36_13125 [Halomonas nitroreducens]
MPWIKVEKPFPFSPDGKSVVEIEAGEQEVSERCAEVAVEHLEVATRLESAPTPATSTAESETSSEDEAAEAGEAEAPAAEEKPAAKSAAKKTQATKR